MRPFCAKQFHSCQPLLEDTVHNSLNAASPTGLRQGTALGGPDFAFYLLGEGGVHFGENI